jgi:ankyrin repeat protein
MATFLLSNGTDINAKTKDGWTALHYAAMHGSAEIVALLLANKVDVNLNDGFGRTSVKNALEGGKAENARLLRSLGGKE